MCGLDTWLLAWLGLGYGTGRLEPDGSQIDRPGSQIAEGPLGAAERTWSMDGRYVVRGLRGKVPLVFSLHATR